MSTTTTDYLLSLVFLLHVTYFFFFQAEDGIRDDLVTGVQTCALPISGSVLQETRFGAAGAYYFYPALQTDSSGNLFVVFGRSSTSVYAELRTTVQLTTDSALGASTLLRAGVADYICSWCSPVSPSRSP